MRRPRDIDAELRMLADKAKDLKARKLSQLGELVIATRADSLDLDVLAGALIAAVEQAGENETTANWRQRGSAFFRRSKQTRKTADSDSQRDAAGAGSGAAH
jgi:hypothetical protein